jgi:DNA invertase Pin-like site-specific DNA recombinase
MAHEWTVLDAQVCTDAALPGARLERPGIQPPLAAADRRPIPFDVLLVDDSSRVARDLADAVRFMQQLTFYGVRVIFISQKRGLAGQLERGHATAAVIYGYRTFCGARSNREV